jgi:hypothetical protein
MDETSVPNQDLPMVSDDGNPLGPEIQKGREEDHREGVDSDRDRVMRKLPRPNAADLVWLVCKQEQLPHTFQWPGTLIGRQHSTRF